MAIVSILHRISGVLLFILVPVLLYILHESLISLESFTHLQTCLAHPVSKFILWVVAAAVFFHLFAGIRHLVMDCGVGESLCVARATAWFVVILTVAALILTGVWLW